MPKSDLAEPRKAKNEEFFIHYQDIEKEISAYLEINPVMFQGKKLLLPWDDPEWSNFSKFFAQNFEWFGLKKLISTGYAIESKTYKNVYQPTLFETSDPQFDPDKTVKAGAGAGEERPCEIGERARSARHADHAKAAFQRDGERGRIGWVLPLDHLGEGLSAPTDPDHRGVASRTCGEDATAVRDI